MELDEKYKKNFGEVLDFKVDSEGNIYVIERASWKVKVLNTKGKLIKKICEEPKTKSGGTVTAVAGAGWRYIGLDEKSGTIYLSVLGKLHIFDNKGNYLREFPFPKFLQRLWIGEKGNIYTEFRKESVMISDIIQEDYMLLTLIPTQGGNLKEIYTYPDNCTKSIKKNSKGKTLLVSSWWHGYEYDMIASNYKSGSLIYGNSREYELNVLDSNGDIILRFRKQEEAKALTLKERTTILSNQLSNLSKRDRDLTRFPETLPFFDHIFTDEKGRIYVRRLRSPLNNEEKFDCDIFSEDGNYIYKTTFDFQPYHIKDGYLSTFKYNKNEKTSSIKKFEIKNWDHIKTGLN